jgi:hypothetical protein
MSRYLFFFFPLVFIFSCTVEEEPFTTWGMKPVYIDAADAKAIDSDVAQIIERGSKIYIRGNYVFIVEHALGVHVIDNSNPYSPIGLRFLSIPGVTDVAVKDDFLFANNVHDIIAIDISNLQEIVVTRRINDVFEPGTDQYPVFFNGYFECADSRKGVVIDWEEALLENPKCRR